MYLEAHRCLWPADEQHSWFVLGMKSLVENKATVILGSASSGKTYLMATHALIDFFCFPKTSLALISSTEKRSMEIKVFGKVKEQYNRAKKLHDFLPGYVLESAMAIVEDSDDIEEGMGREMNRGIICVPCVSGGRFVGMGKFQGAKAPNSPGKYDGILKHYADEGGVMQTSFLDAYSNWMVSSQFKGCMCGNPTDISDPLCTAATPRGGWDAFIDTGKTQEWTSSWYDAHVIAYDGRDTPNGDGNKHPFLITKAFVESLRRTHGDDSWQLYQQGIGKPSRGMVSNRVVTIGLCERHHAFDPVIWMGTPLITIGACDPAFGGGDRCVWMTLQFGKDVNGKMILDVGQPEIIPVKINSRLEASEQIAAFVKDKSDKLSLPASSIVYDSLGSTSLAFAFAKLFGSSCPIPVESGGSADDRPVRAGLYVNEIKNGRTEKRLKTAKEEYSKKITQTWFATREAIVSEQIRNLPREVAEEGQLRMYSVVSGNRTEIEPKHDFKERTRKSCDLYDTFAIGVEGARIKGFVIDRLGNDVETEADDKSWFRDAMRKSQSQRERHSLVRT